MPAPDRFPPWTPPAVRQHVLELTAALDGVFDENGRPAVVILWRLATDRDMRTVWQQLERRAKSESALVKFLECAWQLATLTPEILTPAERITLAELFRKEHELLRLANPELAQYCVPVLLHFGQIRHETGASKLPLVVKRRNRKHSDDRARAYVRVLGDLTRKLFGSVLLQTVATTAEVALQLTIDKRQVQNWTVD